MTENWHQILQKMFALLQIISMIFDIYLHNNTEIIRFGIENTYNINVTFMVCTIHDKRH